MEFQPKWSLENLISAFMIEKFRPFNDLYYKITRYQMTTVETPIHHVINNEK